MALHQLGSMLVSQRHLLSVSRGVSAFLLLYFLSVPFNLFYVYAGEAPVAAEPVADAGAQATVGGKPDTAPQNKTSTSAAAATAGGGNAGNPLLEGRTVPVAKVEDGVRQTFLIYSKMTNQQQDLPDTLFLCSVAERRCCIIDGKILGRN